MMAKRILLFTGKGGVGKTTCAAATALRAAEQGHKTLILSSDPAHSLADALDQFLGPEPQEVTENLFAQEVDLYYSMQKYWGNIRTLLLTLFKWQGVDEIAAEELAALPGMSEASVLLWLHQFYNEGPYDLIVVDSAPTGETLTLLTLPQTTQWWLARAFPFQKWTFQTVGLALRKTTGIPLDKGYAELEALFEKINDIQTVLSDPQISSVRLVANPEKMVIQEARRAYTYLQLYGYAVDALIVNRVLPEVKPDSIWQKYVEAQARYLEEINASFAPLPIYHVPHLVEEVFGFDKLRHIGEALYADRDPAERLYIEKNYDLTKIEGQYALRIRLPFLTAEDFTIQQFGDQLVLQIANQRRNYTLPQFLSYYTWDEAEMDNGWLTVYFVQPDET